MEAGGTREPVRLGSRLVNLEGQPSGVTKRKWRCSKAGTGGIVRSPTLSAIYRSAPPVTDNPGLAPGLSFPGSENARRGLIGQTQSACPHRVSTDHVARLPWVDDGGLSRLRSGSQITRKPLQIPHRSASMHELRTCIATLQFVCCDSPNARQDSRDLGRGDGYARLFDRSRGMA